MKSQKLKFRHALPPLILAAYPILALLAFNIGQIDPTTALRSLVFSISITLILYWGIYLILKNSIKAALALSLALILFYSYGHVYRTFEMVSIFDIHIVRHRYLVPLWSLLLGLGLWRILAAKRTSTAVLQALTAGALLLAVFPVFQIGNYYLAYYRSARENVSTAQMELMDAETLARLPDVYLIILDSYARQDILNVQYEYDNQEFIQGLENLGFYIPDCSLSNYGRTILSLTSQLNLDYIQNLIDEKPRSDPEVYIPYIKQSAARRQLEAFGYQTFAFETGYAFTEINDAGVYLTPHGITSSVTDFSPFEAMLLDTTAIFPLMDLTKHQLIVQSIYYQNYIRAHFTLDKLAELAAIKGKKFVFAHILPPHRPYILTADGSLETDPDINYEDWGVAVDEEHDKIGYRNQVTFLNKRMLEIIPQIIDQSEIPPVILLFSDHGVAPHRDANLAAYFLPGKSTDDLYPTMTSVNSFRVVFNLYFNGEYELLPDESYRSRNDGRYNFREYINKMPACK